MKDKTLLIVGGSVAGVVVLGAAVWAGLGFAAAGSAKTLRDRTLTQARRYASADPYPSEANAVVAGENRKKGEEWEKELAVAVATDEVQGSGDGLSPGDFSRLRESVVAALSKDAPVSEDGSRIVQDGFTFGFGRYSGGTPAEEADVPRLVHQLRLVDALVRKIYDAGVIRIEGVGREVFEDGAEASATDDFSAVGAASGSSNARRGGGGRRGRRGRGGESSSGSEESSSQNVAAAVDIAFPPAPALDGKIDVSRQRFAFVFLAKTPALINLLDSLVAMNPCAVVSSLSIEKAGDDVVFPAENPEGEQTSTRGAAANGLRERPAPRTSRLVSGILREPPVRVRMFVDVYSAPPAEKADAEEEE